MRIVLDTVVLVRSVINPAGSCGRVVFERRKRFVPVISLSIVTEYMAVLQRPKIVRKYDSPGPDVLRSILALIESGVVVEPTETPAVCRDPSDDKFLAAALAGSAQFIVSEDRDLLDLGSYEGIQIISAVTFLRNLSKVR